MGNATFEQLYFNTIIGMILITGAAGFIASCLISRLNAEGYVDLVLVDNFIPEEKQANWKNKQYKELVDRDSLEEWLADNHEHVEFVFHLGARTDTAEFDIDLLNKLNLEYSKMIWNACVRFAIPLVYASSAATYGLGEFGYKDEHDLCNQLQPLNPYGVSKNEFDKWALSQERKPFFWAGLKFFNVYGPNEYHKGRMASVVWHAFNQISRNSEMKLFKSHKDGIADGEQKRDFIYVADVVDVCMFLMHTRNDSGIYNLGTGEARSFRYLVEAVFDAMNKEIRIDFIPTPEDIRDKYQYFTEADMSKLRSIGYDKQFTSLEEGVRKYVQGYLIPGNKVY